MVIKNVILLTRVGNPVTKDSTSTMIVDNPIIKATTLIANSSGLAARATVLAARATVLAANCNSLVTEPTVPGTSMLCHQFW